MIDICFLTTQAMPKSEYNGKILGFTFNLRTIVYDFKTKPQKG